MTKFGCVGRCNVDGQGDNGGPVDVIAQHMQIIDVAHQRGIDIAA